VALRQGHYNQCLRNPGEVFDLLCYADGTYPPLVRYEQKLDAAQKPIPDEWDEIVVLGKDKKPVHRDFAEDQGERLIRKGPIKGDVMRFGWMKRVPDKVPVGLYPANSDFWSGYVPTPIMGRDPETGETTGQPYQPVPPKGQRGHEERKRNHAPILDVLPPEPKIEEAA
jgi:hypothetical protein